MRHSPFLLQLIALLFIALLTACTSTASSAVQSEDVEATVVAKVEATLVADAVSVEQKVQATLTAIAAETQMAIALLPTDTPTTSPTSTHTPTATSALTIEPTPTDLPEPTPTATNQSVGYQVSGPANLRSGPGTDYEIVGALQAGDALSVLARTEDGAWLQIETDSGTQAWIAAFLLETVPALASVPVAALIPAAPTVEPTATVAIAEPDASVPTTGQSLQVSFLNPHYNCDRGSDNVRIRYFQIDLFVTNTSSEPLVAPWYPTRWLIASGDNVRESTEMRQWCNRRTGCYPQPDVLPGGSEGWSWITSRVELHEWVQAVEWEHNGQVYRQEFENNAINRAEWNYKSCQ